MPALSARVASLVAALALAACDGAVRSVAATGVRPKHRAAYRSRLRRGKVEEGVSAGAAAIIRTLTERAGEPRRGR
jgi:hypothetical protein